MNSISKLFFIVGSLIILLSFYNYTTVEIIQPSFQRAELLSCISGVLLILTSLLWTKVDPIPAERVNFNGEVGLIFDKELSLELKEELAWGSNLILKASPAVTMLVYWKDRILIHRGFMGSGEFIPGDISNKVMANRKMISLVKTKLFPGRTEFDPILENLPSVIVYPISNKGLVICGGWSERCFTTADEHWISGWTERLENHLLMS